MVNNIICTLQQLSQRRYCNFSDLTKQWTPVHQMVNDVRACYDYTGYDGFCCLTVKLNDQYSLSVTNNPHAFYDAIEGAARLEIAVIKNGKSLIDDDQFINLRYNDFLAVARVAHHRKFKVSQLIYLLAKQEWKDKVNDETSHKFALEFVDYVRSH